MSGETEPDRDYFQTTIVDDHILNITINRPEVKNAFNGAMAQQLETLIDRFDQDTSLWIAIITGSGDTFSSGQDLKAARKNDIAVTERRGVFGILAVPPKKPTIAAIDGYALAGGMEIALSCDLIVATTTSQFGLTEVRHGLLAAGGGCFRLPRRIPYHIAMEMALTGALKTAQDMHQVGLVNHIAEPGQAVECALAMARKIAVNSPAAVQCAREVVYRSEAERWTDSQAWSRQEEPYETLKTSDDFREGLKAFAKKRKPVWKGT